MLITRKLLGYVVEGDLFVYDGMPYRAMEDMNIYKQMSSGKLAKVTQPVDPAEAEQWEHDEATWYPRMITGVKYLDVFREVLNGLPPTILSDMDTSDAMCLLAVYSDAPESLDLSGCETISDLTPFINQAASLLNTDKPQPVTYRHPDSPVAKVVAKVGDDTVIYHYNVEQMTDYMIQWLDQEVPTIVESARATDDKYQMLQTTVTVRMKDAESGDDVDRDMSMFIATVRVDNNTYLVVPDPSGRYQDVLRAELTMLYNEEQVAELLTVYDKIIYLIGEVRALSAIETDNIELQMSLQADVSKLARCIVYLYDMDFEEGIVSNTLSNLKAALATLEHRLQDASA